MRYTIDHIRTIDWVSSGSASANGNNVSFTGAGSVTGIVGVDFAPDEFIIELQTNNPTNRYSPKAFVHVWINYKGGDTFKGTYPIVNGQIKEEPTVGEMGERNTDFDLYPVNSISVKVESQEPMEITGLRFYKSTPDVVTESDGGFTKDDNGNYNIGDNVTGNFVGGGNPGGGDPGGGFGGVYIHSVPVSHTVYDPFEVGSPPEGIDAYVDGMLMEVKHNRRPDFSEEPTGNVPDGEYIDPHHIPPAWAPYPEFGGYGAEGPKIIKYLLANDGRVYINWGGGGDIFYLTSDFTDPFQTVHGYYVKKPSDGSGGDGEPLDWVLATDDDFELVQVLYNKWSWVYKGPHPYVEIPYVINGEVLTNYDYMFKDNHLVRGVKSDNKNITSMINMFSGTKGRYLHLNALDTSSVEDMFGMFQYSKVEELNISKFDTSNVTHMGNMFLETRELYNLDINNFITSKVTDMDKMFQNSGAQSLDLRNFDTSNVRSMTFMFSRALARTIDVSSFNTRKVRDMGYMFQYTQTRDIDLTSFELAGLSANNPLEKMFEGASASIGYARNIVEAEMYNETSNKPVTLTFVVKGDTGWVVASDDDFRVNNNGYYEYIGTNLYVEIPHQIKGENIITYKEMFRGANVLGVKSTNKSIMDMSNMFRDSKAGRLNLYGLDTSSVKYMDSMFSGSNAKELDLGGFDTSKVVSMGNMFFESRATKINTNSFNTSNVNDMSAMFYESSVVGVLDLSNFNTSNVTDMRWMFWGVGAEVDVTSFNTGKVETMYGMFYDTRMNVIDLSSFTTTSNVDLGHMFQRATAKTGYAKNSTEVIKFNGSLGKPSHLVFTVK